MSTLRIYGFDLIRFFSFFAILIFHLDWMVFYEREYTPSTLLSIWPPFEYYARALSFSGQTILFLSALLLGKAHTSLKKPLLVAGFALAASILFLAFEYGLNEVTWVWDIYSLIAFGLLTTGLILHFVPKLTVPLAIFGFLLIWIPFWKFQALIELPLAWRQALIGECQNDLADWPILPWIGLIFWGYSLGFGLRVFPDWKKGLAKISKPELGVWGAALLGSIYFLGEYFVVPLGPHFACHVFRREPIVFFAHFVWILFLMRVSMLVKINQALGKVKWVVWLSKLRISTHFGLLYVTHFLIWYLFSRFAAIEMQTHPWFYFAVFILILPVCEVILRFFTKPKKF